MNYDEDTLRRHDRRYLEYLELERSVEDAFDRRDISVEEVEEKVQRFAAVATEVKRLADALPETLDTGRPVLRVEEVEVAGAHRLKLTFNDETRKIVNVHPLLKGVHERLLDPEEFARARVEHGTVVWPSPEREAPDEPHITDLDFAPEALYALPAVQSMPLAS